MNLLQAARQHPFTNTTKVAFSLVFVTILLLTAISPPFQYNRRSKISESATSFNIEYEDIKSPVNNDITIAKTLSIAQKAPEEIAATFSIPSDPQGEIDSAESITEGRVKDEENCDLFSGEWIPNPEGPYYTNETCYSMHEHQNCMKYGKPDSGYLRWRWKPDGCELPIFDPNKFLELVRGKSIAFVGDSMARNHVQSLSCLLTRVVYPENVPSDDDSVRQDWVYKDYNFNMSVFWAPHLVRSERPDPNNVTCPINLYLDEYDESWTAKIEGYHYIIISAGHWFFHPSKYYENRVLVSCSGCNEDNVTQTTGYFGYEKAFRTALRAINSFANSKALIFLRTISISHFEGGDWGDGGDCVRTRPFKRNETVLESYYSAMREIQLQEFRIAEEEGRKRGLRIRLLDVTQPMSLRPDGHPSKYGPWPTENLNRDCLHWCLPGPVDTWNDLLLQLLVREEVNP